MGFKSERPMIGIIGGSSLKDMDHLEAVEKLDISTPWGSPTSLVTIFHVLSDENDVLGEFAYIVRHGVGNPYSPERINNRANIAALKSIGCEFVVGFSAVGSLRQEIEPGNIVLPDDLIDRTMGRRPCTFFDKVIYGHASFGAPFSTSLNKAVKDILSEFLPAGELHTEKTLVVMEGPAFSTRAESKLHRAWGGDIINMSTVAEAKLAREAEMEYVVICTSTDYDSWKTDGAPVELEEIFDALTAITLRSKSIALELLRKLCPAVASGQIKAKRGAMKNAICTFKNKWPASEAADLSFILPDIFGSQDIKN